MTVVSAQVVCDDAFKLVDVFGQGMDDGYVASLSNSWF